MRAETPCRSLPRRFRVARLATSRALSLRDESNLKVPVKRLVELYVVWSSELLLVEDRCENLRSKISKIPRRSLMSRFEIHRASDARASFGSFPHSRSAFLIILGAQGQEIFEGMSFAYSRLRQSH